MGASKPRTPPANLSDGVGVGHDGAVTLIFFRKVQKMGSELWEWAFSNCPEIAKIHRNRCLADGSALSKHQSWEAGR
jgi:hypothetical protein